MIMAQLAPVVTSVHDLVQRFLDLCHQAIDTGCGSFKFSYHNGVGTIVFPKEREDQALTGRDCQWFKAYLTELQRQVVRGDGVNVEFHRLADHGQPGLREIWRVGLAADVGDDRLHEIATFVGEQLQEKRQSRLFLRRRWRRKLRWQITLWAIIAMVTLLLLGLLVGQML